MKLIINWNDAWESVPLEYATTIAERIKEDLEPSHPLCGLAIYPVAKLWRRWKYLLEDENDPHTLWLLDMQKKKRFEGKTVYWFKRIEDQKELDQILYDDLQNWIEYMKDAGAWEE